MKQVVQSYKTGLVSLRNVPIASCNDKSILVKNINSLVSIGTERTTIELGKKSLIGKAISRPDLVSRALSKAKKEGFTKTWNEAMGRLDIPTPLGYSSAGIVVESGISASEFSPGDRVACIGQGYASHAEYISVPINLACRIPKNVSNEEASFGMLGIIALHGVRSANLTFGSKVAVIGLGLLGLLCAQILNAYGTEIVAYDPDTNKINLAKIQGISSSTQSIEEFKELVKNCSNGAGVDAVIVAAASVESSPIDIAIELCRFKGRIVVVGTADIHPVRNQMWEKEIELVVSRAGGPGSLDAVYEIEGVDLPIGEVRWTEKRNLKEFLRLISEGRVNIKQLITHRFSIDSAEEVYKKLINKEIHSPVGVLFEYEAHHVMVEAPVIMGADEKNIRNHKIKKISKDGSQLDDISIGVIGAGLFGKALLLPALRKISNIKMHTLITSSGVSAEHSGSKFGFINQGTNPSTIWSNDEIDAVIGLTPHSNHLEIVAKAIASAKPVFLEKPLCISVEELGEIEILAQNSPQSLVMIGHNRRYSPHTSQIREWIKWRKHPLVMQIRINAGYIDSSHWVHSDVEGRSRIVGEMSHFIDLASTIVNSKVIRIFAEKISSDGGVVVNNDNVIISMKFEDGSVCSLTYTASGEKAYSRESLEIFCEGKTIASRDYRISEIHHNGKIKHFKTKSQEMGYEEELKKFISSILECDSMDTSLQSEIHTMKVIFGIEKSLSTAKAINIK